MERVRAELLATGNVSDASAERLSRSFIKAAGEARRFGEAARSTPRTYPGLEALETSLESVGQEADLAGDRITASMAKIAGTSGAAARGGPWKQYGDELRDELAATTVSVGQSTTAWTSMFSTTSRQGRFALQNLGFQVADFAVQVGAGTSALRAFSMQAPQALSAFGGVGIAVGTAIAVLGPLAAMFLSSGEKARTSAEALKELEAELERLTEQYRQATGAARELAGERIRIEIETTGREVFDEQQQAIEDLKAALIDLRLTAEAAVVGKDIFAGFVGGENVKARIDEITDAMSANVIDSAQWAEEMNKIIQDVATAFGEPTDFTTNLANRLRDLVDTVVESQGRIADATRSQQDLIAGLSPEKYRALRTEIADLGEQASIAAKALQFPIGTEGRARFEAFIELMQKAGVTLDEVAQKDPAVLKDLFKGVDEDAARRASERIDELAEKIQDLRDAIATARLPEHLRSMAAAFVDAGGSLESAEWDAAAEQITLFSRELDAIDFAEKMRELGDTTAIARLAPELRAAAQAAREMGMQPFDVPTPEQAANLRIAPLRAQQEDVADFEDVIRRLENKQVVLQLPTQDLRDAAEAALALGQNLDGVTGPEQLQAALAEMPAEVQGLIDLFVALSAAARQVSFAEGLEDQVEQLRLAASTGGRETPESRLAMARLQARQTMDLGEGEALPPEVEAALAEANALRTRVQGDAARIARENERAQAEARLRFAPADIAARQFTGIDTEASRIEQRRLEARQQANLPPTAALAPEVEEDIVQIERANTALAEYQQTWQVTQQEQGFEQQAAQLEAVAANRGRETEEMRIQATLGQVRITQGEAAAAAVEDEVRALEAARTASQAVAATAGLEDQVALLRLSNSFLGEETEEYRVQMRELQLKQQLGEAYNDTTREQIGLLEAELTRQKEITAERAQRQEIEGLERQLGSQVNPLDRISERLIGTTSEATRVAEREAGLANQGFTPEQIEGMRAATEEAVRLETQIAAITTTGEVASETLADFGLALLEGDTDAFFQSLLQHLIELQLQLAADLVVALALRAALGATGGAGAAAGGGGAGGPTQLFPGLYAAGGSIASGQRAVTGEQGKELFLADRALRRAPQLEGDPDPALAALGTSPEDQALIAMVSAATAVRPSRGEAMILGERGAQAFSPEESGQIYSHRDLRVLESTEAGREWLENVGRGSLRGLQGGGSVQRGQRAVVGEVGAEIWVSDRALRRARQAGGMPETEAAAAEVVGSELAMLAADPATRDLLAMVAGVAPVVPRRGEAMLVGTRGPVPLVPDESGTVISNRDLRRLRSTEEGRLFLREVERGGLQGRQRGGPVDRGRAVVAGEGDVELWLPETVHRRLQESTTETDATRDVRRLTETDLEQVREATRALELAPLVQHQVTARGRELLAPQSALEAPRSAPGLSRPPSTAQGADHAPALHGVAATARPVRAPQVVGRRGFELITPDFDGVVISHEHLTEIRASEAGRAVLAELGVEGPAAPVGDGASAAVAALIAAAPAVAPAAGAGDGATASAGAAVAMMAAGGRVRRGQRIGVGESRDELVLDQASLEALTAATGSKSPDTTRVLASAQAAQAMAAPQQAAPRTEVNVIDQRPHGAPPIEQRRTTGADGREVLTLLVRGAINDMRQSGDFAEMMRADFGMRPTAR